MKSRISSPLIALGLFLTSPITRAEWEFAPQATTLFPAFVGAGFGATLDERFAANLLYGFTPRPYYETIGQVAAAMSGNAAHRDVIEAAFQSNGLLRLTFQYHFDTAASGWRVGASGAWLNSSGDAEIDRVLTAVTGRDYTTLKNLLIAAGRSTEVSLKGDLYWLEIHGGYAWQFKEKWSVAATVGVVKVIASQVNLKTGLPAFEASAGGSSLMRQSESDLETIITRYGVSPTLGVSVSYRL